MDFANESYTRQYTRKTVTNRMLGWDGRAVLWAMNAGEFDRKGYFDFQDDPAESIAAVTEIPLEIVKTALVKLFKTRTWVLEDGRIFWPNYEEAQTCRKSDRQRQRECRSNREPSSPSHPVTRRHTESQDVTPSLAQPSSAQPSQAEDPERARAVVEESPVAEPPTHRRLPKPWKPTEAFYGEALMAGVPRDVLDEDVTYWRSRDLGADVHDFEGFFRSHFPRLKKRSETERYRDAQQPRAGPRPLPSLVLEPTAKHEAYARKHNLDLAPILRALAEEGVVESLGLGRAKEILGQRLAAAARQRAIGGVT